MYVYIHINIIYLYIIIASTNRAFYFPSIIRQPLVNAFVANTNMTSLIVLLQQICNGFSRQALVISPELAKLNKFKNEIPEEKIMETREFLGQIVNDIARSLNQSSSVAQIMQELLEVNSIYFFIICILIFVYLL